MLSLNSTLPLSLPFFLLSHTNATTWPDRSTRKFDIKLFKYISVGTITLFYCVIEIAAALYLDSLALLSDGVHNLGDVLAVALAAFAHQVRCILSSSDLHPIILI